MSKSRDRRRRAERRLRNSGWHRIESLTGVPLADWQRRYVEALFANYRRRYIAGVDYRGRGA